MAANAKIEAKAMTANCFSNPSRRFVKTFVIAIREKFEEKFD